MITKYQVEKLAYPQDLADSGKLYTHLFVDKMKRELYFDEAETKKAGASTAKTWQHTDYVNFGQQKCKMLGACITLFTADVQLQNASKNSNPC